MSTAAGHDDQVLAEPKRLGVVEPVSESFFMGTSRFFLRWWSGASKADRFDLLADASATGYGSRVQGEDTDLRLTAAYRRLLSSGAALDLSGTGRRFRRDQGAGGDPVFDLDLYRIEGVLALAVGEGWLTTVGAEREWTGFPGRMLKADSLVTENQRQVNLSVAGIRNLGAHGYVSAELQYRWSGSNEISAEYEGPVVTLRSRVDLPAAAALTARVTYLHRGYDHAVVETGIPADPGLQRRTDDAWLYTLTLEKRVSSRIRLFALGTFLDQRSNDPLFDYEQTRLSLGIAVDVLAPEGRGWPRKPGGAEGLDPRRTPQGVRFRYRNPGAVEVCVVGGFNAWAEGRHPLRGPDGDGYWEVVVPLDPGIWRYAFIVDGRWMRPPGAARYEDDGFGGEHGVLEVPGVEGDVTVSPEARPSG